VFCCVGAFSINNRVFDVALTVGFGLLGYLFRKAKCEPGPLLLGFVLGPLLETNLRRALLLSQGDPRVLVERPISLALLIAALALLALMVFPAVRNTRKAAFTEEEA
jgi:putative tricarboxylic transport membrane protein